MQLKERITQGMLELFEAAMREEKQTGTAETRGALARSAMVAGWFTETAEVNELDPREVRAMAEQVSTVYLDLLDISPYDQGGSGTRPQPEKPAAA